MVWLVRWFKWLKIPSSFTVSSNTQNIQIDHPYQILWILLPEDSTNTDIFWNSSDESIATVDEWWLITPVSVWECTITWHTASNWLIQTIAVTTYVVHTTGVELNMDTMMLVPWTPQQLIATVSPELTNYPEVTWSSSDDSIATVDSDWLVTYVADWSCTITCTTVDWWFTDTCEVTCIVPVQSVSLNKTSWTIGSWETIQLVPTINPSNATIKTVTYSSSNTRVATVSSTWLINYVADWTATITCTTTQWGKTATCTVTCEDKKPVSKTFSYTWADQSYTVPYTQCYKLEAWWWGSYDAKWWYASWIMCLTKWTVLRIMVWAKGNNGWTRYWFGWASNYSNSYDWAWLSWIFTGNTAIWASDSSRALVIWWWAWSCAGRWNGWAWGWECWASWWTWWYWTQWWWWTQSWRQSWWNVWWAQFCWGNGSWSYWAWWGWWWYWWNWTQWDSSAWDDKWAWGWSWYVKSTMTSRTLTQWWWSAAQTHWSVKISSVWNNTYDFYYDFRNWSLAWFQAAWWTWIYTDWSYTIDSWWLGQTWSSNDRNTHAYVTWLNFQWARLAYIERLWYWVRDSWSNGKWMWFWTSYNWWNGFNWPGVWWRINLNTASPETYSTNWVNYYPDWATNYEKYAANGWETTERLEINFETKIVKYILTWANSKTFQISITDAQKEWLLWMTWVWRNWWRWYSSYNSERIRWVKIHIEY